MKVWDEKLHKEKLYLIGVSGGPDSMALLDMCRRGGYHAVALHMNYQKRKSALRDENIVKEYCRKYGIPCEIRRQNKNCQGNFQAFARKERYLFYSEMLKKWQGEAVLLAHQMDDCLETWLMQKQRASIKEYCGIKEDIMLYGCRILRPLLTLSKQELEDYCVQNKVPFGIDETNLEDTYTRNRIRHEVVEHMSQEEKGRMLIEMAEYNKRMEGLRQEAESFLNCWKQDAASLLAQREELQRLILTTWIFQETGVRISGKELVQLLLLVKQNASHWTRGLKEEYDIYHEYGLLQLERKEQTGYCYHIHTEEEWFRLQSPWFHIAKKGRSVEALTLKESDYPLVIRNAREHDVILLRFGKKKLNRWFIDRKIPRKQRKIWPVVVNREGKVVLIPEIGCDIAHFSNNPTVFVVK